MLGTHAGILIIIGEILESLSDLQSSCPCFNHLYFSIIQEGLKDIFERAVEVVTKGKNSKEENVGGCFPKAISHSFRNCSIL